MRGWLDVLSDVEARCPIADQAFAFYEDYRGNWREIIPVPPPLPPPGGAGGLTVVWRPAKERPRSFRFRAGPLQPMRHALSM
jgi:hypothetical protein